MQGSLTQVPLPEVLQFVSMGKSSGILKLARDRSEITLSVHDGRIINSSAIDRRRRLGDLLVNRGALKRSELSRLLKLQKTVESDKRLGQILVERDIVTEDTIRNILRMQLEEEIWNLFGWKDGDFSFESMDPRQLGDAIVQIDIEPLILEGTRRHDEWLKILKIIPHDRLIPMTFKPGDDFKRHLSLRQEEWRGLSLINGHFTVRAIVNRSNLGRFEVHMITANFIHQGLVYLLEPDHHQTQVKPKEAVKTESESSDKSNGSTEKVKKGKKEEQEKVKGGLLNKVISGLNKEKAEAKDSLEFMSPMSAIAFLTTEYVRRISEMKEFTPNRGDETLLDRIWIDLSQTYTKADLVEVTHNNVDCSVMESYMEKCGFGPVTEECIEDGLEGMMQLLITLHRVFTKRVGERATTKVVREILEEVGGRTEVKYCGPFHLSERVQTALRLT